MASHYKRKNGTYCVRVYYGTKDGIQKVVSQTYYPPVGISQKAVERDLKRFEKGFEDMVRAGVYVPGSHVVENKSYHYNMTLKHFINHHYKERIWSKLSPNTIRLYESVIDQIIIPSFGDLRLIDIRKSHLQSMVDYLAEDPTARKDTHFEKELSKGTIIRYATVFRSVINEAYNMCFLDENPFNHGPIDYPKSTSQVKQHHSTIKAYGYEEIEIFLRALKKENPLTRVLLLASVVLGARRSELIALTWEDVDFERGCININKSAYKPKGMAQQIKSPKTEHGYRDIFFPEIFGKELLSWRAEQDRISEEARDKWEEQGFIFTGKNGKMLSIYAMTRMCDRFEKRNEMRHLKLHGLRHTFDSILFSKGVGLETIKELMGHKSIKTTEIYTHALLEDKRRAAGIMNEVISVYDEKERNDGAKNGPATC